MTARSDVWAAARISPILRDAALTLRGADLWRKVRPPGDTTLRSGAAWCLEPLLTVADAAGRAPPPAPPPVEQVSAALALLPPGQYELDELAKGQPARAAAALQQPPVAPA